VSESGDMNGFSDQVALQIGRAFLNAQQMTDALVAEAQRKADAIVQKAEQARAAALSSSTEMRDPPSNQAKSALLAELETLEKQLDRNEHALLDVIGNRTPSEPNRTSPMLGPVAAPLAVIVASQPTSSDPPLEASQARSALLVDVEPDFGETLPWGKPWYETEDQPLPGEPSESGRTPRRQPAWLTTAFTVGAALVVLIVALVFVQAL